MLLFLYLWGILFACVIGTLKFEDFGFLVHNGNNYHSLILVVLMFIIEICPKILELFFEPCKSYGFFCDQYFFHTFCSNMITYIKIKDNI